MYIMEKSKQLEIRELERLLRSSTPSFVSKYGVSIQLDCDYLEEYSL